MHVSLPPQDFSPQVVRAPSRPTTARSFGTRAFAYVIDAVVINVLATPFVYLTIRVVLPLMGLQTNTSTGTSFIAGLQLLIGLANSLLYFVPCEWLFGATIGKLVLRMCVVQIDGSPCGLAPAFLRGILRFIDVILFGLVAYVSMSGDRSLRQRLGDKAAHTVVVDRTDPFVHKHPSPWRLVVALIAFVATAPAAFFALELGTGWMTITPVRRPVAVSAAASNLQATDFTPAIALSRESGPDRFPDYDGKDINQRMLESGDAVVQSRVMLFDTILADTFEDLSSVNKKRLAAEFEGTALNVAEGKFLPVGEVAVFHKFTESGSGAEGYIISFRRANAIATLIFYGPPGQFTPEQAMSVAKIIDGRLTSSKPQGE